MEPDKAEAAFDEARADAQLAPDEVVFVPFAARAPLRIHEAALFPPEELPEPAEVAGLSDEEVARLDGNHMKFRVTCWLGMADELVLPVLRHELEHARQWRKGGGKPQAELAGSLARLIHILGYGDLPNNGQFYNLIPTERDANAAASRLIRRKVGHAEADQLMRKVDPGLLRRQPDPEPYESLGRRLICHAAIWPTEVEQVLQLNRRDPASFFDTVSGGGQELWRSLKSDRELSALADAARKATPVVADIESAPTPEDGWKPARDAILRAADRARQLADLPPAPRPTYR